MKLLAAVHVLPALACCVALAACGGKKDAPSSQVAATVNGQEISVHQVNFTLQQRPDLVAQGPAAGRSALDELINQQLAVQGAVDAKLDRDPDVLQALEAGRREILTRAFLGRIAGSSTPPSNEEISRFYAEKPGLFKARRVYNFHEYDIDIPPDRIAEFEAQLVAQRSPQAAEQFIAGSGLKYTMQAATRVPEGLPLDLLDKVTALSDGQTLLVASPPRGVRAMVLLASIAAPVPEAQARPAIEAYIVNLRKREAVESQLKSMRAQADVKYNGVFAAPAADAAASR